MRLLEMIDSQMDRRCLLCWACPPLLLLLSMLTLIGGMAARGVGGGGQDRDAVRGVYSVVAVQHSNNKNNKMSSEVEVEEMMMIMMENAPRLALYAAKNNKVACK